MFQTKFQLFVNGVRKYNIEQEPTIYQNIKLWMSSTTSTPATAWIKNFLSSNLCGSSLSVEKYYNNGKHKFLAELNSAYLSDFITLLGHESRDSHKTKFFNVEENEMPNECVEGDGVVTSSIIPRTQDCANSQERIFTSVEMGCDFATGTITETKP